jgi:hypothetical protein
LDPQNYQVVSLTTLWVHSILILHPNQNLLKTNSYIWIFFFKNALCFSIGIDLTFHNMD